MTITDDRGIAARLATEAVLNGNINDARVWALEYAKYRDHQMSDAELRVCLAGHADRRHARGEWFPGEHPDAD